MIPTVAYGVGVHAAAANDDRRTNAQLPRLDLRLGGIVAEAGAHTDPLPAQFIVDAPVLFHELGGRGIVFPGDGNHARGQGEQRGKLPA